MNDAQKERFLLLTEKYYHNILHFSSSNFEFVKYSIVGGRDYHSPYKKGFLVTTEILSLDNKKQVFKIDFRLLRIKETNHLKIVDVRIEGISLLINNYRAAIKSMLRSHKGNTDVFLDKLALKLKK